MASRPARKMNLVKAVRYAVAVNVLQIAAALAMAIYAAATGGRGFEGVPEQLLLWCMVLVISWGAALDIRDAYGARRAVEEADMLEAAYGQLEALNGQLRAQRHDFMNHLQVLSGLIELGEHASALDYLNRVYGDIQRVGRTLKTAHPAINALLAAKMADCESRGISFHLAIDAPWERLPMPGWEMCRVLGNLIDNAIDALGGGDAPAGPALEVRMGEDARAFWFTVENNGPKIAPEIRGRIFEAGFSTKGEGRGTGLSIVRELVEGYGGELRVDSDERRTAFWGRISKPAQPQPA
ncbi:MAG: GHKL domain-containing protein [Clostridiales bacterium]|nr:GHKL domain-containing protein [Clostridiales bacterium]